MAAASDTPPSTPKADKAPTPKPKPKPSTSKVDVRYIKRKPLTKVEKEFLKERYYKESGFPGRTVFYRQLIAHYDKNDTPPEQRISRRRLWMWLSAQEVNQLHRPARKNSLVIKPITSAYRLDKCQCDCISRGGDSARIWKGILCVIDVSTRYAWTERLKNIDSKTVSAAMKLIMGRAYDQLPEEDKKQKTKDYANGKSKTWVTCTTDNGPEFKKVWLELMKDSNINYFAGVANKSTSQSLVERLNRSIQDAMQREQTATGKKWYNLVESATKHYNRKTNRLLRLKPIGDPKAPYKYYTPEELYAADRDTLARLYQEKNDAVMQQNKAGGKEGSIQVGDKVRLVDFGKRKAALAKGFRSSWSKELYRVHLVKGVKVGDIVRIQTKEKKKRIWSTELYTVYKSKRPKSSSTEPLPTLYYVKEKESDKAQDEPYTSAQLDRTDPKPTLYYVTNIDTNKKRKEPYTINDLQRVEGEVEKAPSEIQVKDDTTRVTRSTDKDTTGAPPKPKKTPKPKEPTKPKPPPKPDTLIGKKVKSWIDVPANKSGSKMKEVVVFGTIIDKKGRKKNGRMTYKYRVEWEEDYKDEYDWKQYESFTKGDVTKILDTPSS